MIHVFDQEGLKYHSPATTLLSKYGSEKTAVHGSRRCGVMVATFHIRTLPRWLKVEDMVISIDLFDLAQNETQRWND